MFTEKKTVTEEMLLVLREAVRGYQTEKRYRHTLAVEREAEALGKIFLPDDVNRLRAAALLHDITKILDVEKQLKICSEFDIMIRGEDTAAPKLFHAKTGAAVAKRDFSSYVDADILSAVYYHTTGRSGMSIFEMLIYLADYIEDTRTFEDCVTLRKMFYDGIGCVDGKKEKLEVLRRTMIRSFDMTVKCLIDEGALVDRDTIEARNWFILNEID
ncbi:MAG: bis(5'-nucleosyl)-tetraphosphatase (symmetrical) YqeK [Clostridia bacterium]|nr:bis(5'-nucleosyl)-tetraphosphatase (symmetrical) YqeK [Clostridia bacterium]